MSQWVHGFTQRPVASLQAVNATVVARMLGPRMWTIDIDGVVVSTGMQVG